MRKIREYLILKDSYAFQFSRSANKCLLKVAQFAAQLEKYQKAIEIYEQVCLFIFNQV